MDIIVSLKGQEISRVDSQTLVADAQNQHFVAYQMGVDWSSLSNPIAIFTKSGKTISVPIVAQRSILPNEMLKSSGSFTISVVAGSRMTCGVVTIPVSPSGLKEGNAPLPPTPNFFEKYIKSFENLFSKFITLENKFLLVESSLSEVLSTLPNVINETISNVVGNFPIVSASETVFGESLVNSAELTTMFSTVIPANQMVRSFDIRHHGTVYHGINGECEIRFLINGAVLYSTIRPQGARDPNKPFFFIFNMLVKNNRIVGCIYDYQSLDGFSVTSDNGLIPLDIDASSDVSFEITAKFNIASPVLRYTPYLTRIG